MPVQLNGLEAEGILASRNHGQGNRVTITSSVKVLGFKPGAEAGIVDIRLVAPEAGVKPALDLKMIELQLYDRDSLGKITPNVGYTHMQPGEAAPLALCFDHHTYLLFNVG